MTEVIRQAIKSVRANASYYLPENQLNVFLAYEIANRLASLDTDGHWFLVEREKVIDITYPKYDQSDELKLGTLQADIVISNDEITFIVECKKVPDAATLSRKQFEAAEQARCYAHYMSQKEPGKAVTPICAFYINDCRMNGDLVLRV